MNHIAVVGSANADLVVRQPRLPVPGETLAGSGFAVVAGGKGLNQAVAAARAGAEVAFIGRIGGDAHGQLLHEALEREGVSTERLATDVHATSGVAAVSVLDDGENAIVVVGGANDSADFSRDDARLVASSQAVMAQLERPIALVRAAFEEGRRAGVLTVLTPAPVSTDALRVLGLTDLLLANETEAATLSGVADPVVAAAMLSERVPTVVVTLGAEGAVVARAGELIHEQPARPTRVIDTTGAGDCFAGTLVARLIAGETLTAALAAATAAASLSVGRHGASTSMPTAQEVESLLEMERGADWIAEQPVRPRRE